MSSTNQKIYLGMSAYQFAFLRITVGVIYGFSFLLSAVSSAISSQPESFIFVVISMLSFAIAFGFHRKIISGILLLLLSSLFVFSLEVVLTLNFATLIWIHCLWLLIPMGEPWSRQPKNLSWTMPKHLILFSWVLFLYFLGLNILDLLGHLPAVGVLNHSITGLIVFFLLLFDRRWLKPLRNSEKKVVIYFDGVCNLCNGFVDFLISEDQSHQIRFAALQGSSAKADLPNLNTEQLDSVIVKSDETILKKSAAVFTVLSHIGGFWKVFVILKFIPQPICDFFYDWVAKNRYSFFGKQLTCRLPSESERKLFLD